MQHLDADSLPLPLWRVRDAAVALVFPHSAMNNHLKINKLVHFTPTPDIT